jgi:hypothetical protein
MIQSLILRSMLFALVCGILGYMLFVIITFLIAMCMVFAFIFDVLSRGGVPFG